MGDMHARVQREKKIHIETLPSMLIASSAVVADPRWMRAVQRVAGDRWPYADRGFY